MSYYHMDPSAILAFVDDFIMWKSQDKFTTINQQIDKNKNDLLQLFDKIERERKESFYNCIYDQNKVKYILTKHRLISSLIDQRYCLRLKMVEELNKLLQGKVRLSISKSLRGEDINYLFNSLPKHVTNSVQGYYPHEVNIKRVISQVATKSRSIKHFDFFASLLDNDTQGIIDQYNLNTFSESTTIIDEIRSHLTSTMLEIFFEDNMMMEYNINAGTFSNEEYKPNGSLSLGQNAVAILLLVLDASLNLSDTRPLIMDQPEDNLDNSYIYTTLINEFRRSKQARQIIISTHNANIPVASDAENIIVLKYNGKHGHIATNGSIDSPRITTEVLDIMEGGREALDKRVSKYNYS